VPKQTVTQIQSRTATRLAWVLWAILLLLEMAGMILAFLVRSFPDSILPLFSRVLLFFPQIVSFLTIGALIATRQPRNPIGWLFLAGGFVDAFGQFAEGYWRYALFVRPGALPAGELMLWVNTRAYAIETIFTTLLILLFPTGRPPSRRWWIAGWLIILGGLGNQAALAFMPGPLDPSVSITNPLGVSSAASFLQFIADLGNYMELLGVLGVILSLIARFRRANGVERQQVKLLAYALAIYATTASSLEPISYLATSSGEPSPILNIFFILQAFAAVFVAIAAGIAILLPAVGHRHHHPSYAGLLHIDADARAGVCWLHPAASHAGGATHGQLGAGDCGLDAGDRRAVQPAAKAHPESDRPALLPPQVRRRQSAGCLRRNYARRDRSGRADDADAEGGGRDYAAGVRRPVAARANHAQRAR
jgi:hypothetical protein